MSSKNTTEVIIGGKVFTLGGYESEEYLQKIATYINNKLAEFTKDDGFRNDSRQRCVLILCILILRMITLRLRSLEIIFL